MFDDCWADCKVVVVVVETVDGSNGLMLEETDVIKAFVSLPLCSIAESWSGLKSKTHRNFESMMSELSTSFHCLTKKNNLEKYLEKILKNTKFIFRCPTFGSFTHESSTNMDWIMNLCLLFNSVATCALSNCCNGCNMTAMLTEVCGSMIPEFGLTQ